jgi:acetoin utilization deacetylase AcuC-like enzyme
MEILFNSKFLLHNVESYAEGSYRIEDFALNLDDTDLNGEAYITLVHSEAHLERVRDACLNKQVLAEVSLSPESYKAACSAVGLAVMASERGDFAAIRPPGHHAKSGQAAGFCLFNNIAIATQKLVNEGKKVFILDIDGHHGDGTQQIFYNSDQVLFCSIHQQYVYPGTGNRVETGSGSGIGYTLNFPLSQGSGDKELLEAVDEAIQRATDFKPDVVGVSAGFDGYLEDRLLGLKYTLNGYFQVGRRLSQSFDHVFAVLEGGYHQDNFKCTGQFVKGVNRML